MISYEFLTVSADRLRKLYVLPIFNFCLRLFPWRRNFIRRGYFTRITLRNDVRLFFREIRSNTRLYFRVRPRTRNFKRGLWLYLFWHSKPILLNSTRSIQGEFADANKTS